MRRTAVITHCCATLVLPEFVLAMGPEVVRGIADVLESRGPDHLETSLLLEEIESEGDTALATIRQRLGWKATGEPADSRSVKARFFFSDDKIRRVELLG
jgi:hypothetical protein